MCNLFIMFAALIQGAATAILCFLTYKYVKSSEEYAKTSREQFKFIQTQEDNKLQIIIDALYQEILENINITELLNKSIQKEKQLRESLGTGLRAELIVAPYQSNTWDTFRGDLSKLNEEILGLLPKLYANMKCENQILHSHIMQTDAKELLIYLSRPNTKIKFDDIGKQLENIRDIIKKNKN